MKEFYCHPKDKPDQHRKETDKYKTVMSPKMFILTKNLKPKTHFLFHWQILSLQHSLNNNNNKNDNKKNQLISVLLNFHFHWRTCERQILKNRITKLDAAESDLSSHADESTSKKAGSYNSHHTPQRCL